MLLGHREFWREKYRRAYNRSTHRTILLPGISEELRPGKSNQRVEHSAKSSAATSGSSEDGEPRKAYLTATKPVQDNGNVYLAALEEYVDAETAKAADRQAAVKPNLPAVGNAEADSHGKSHLTALEQKEAVAKVDTALARPPRSKRLDIVLSHFHPDRVQPALDFWLDFLESDKVHFTFRGIPDPT